MPAPPVLPRTAAGTLAALTLLLSLGAAGALAVPMLSRSTETVGVRTSGTPAWGDPRWTMRYAFNGRCDDPRYVVSNGGRAEPGTDEADCALYGQGLR